MEGNQGPEEKKTNIVPKLETFEATIKGLNAFKEYFHPKADVVYYPSSGPDISVAKAFPESRVIFVDGNEHIVKDLIEGGYEAHTELSQTFTPDTPVDILVLINPMVNHEKPFEVLRENGYVVCNNYHHTATALKDHPGFVLKGAIDNAEVNTENLNEYWEYIDTDEELKRSSIYPQISQIVKNLTGNELNIVEEYKKILSASELGGVMVNGRFTPLFDLPRKRKAGLFIFEKEQSTDKETL